MAEDQSEVERLKEAIRLIELALRDCHRYLAQKERSKRGSSNDGEDSTPLWPQRTP